MPNAPALRGPLAFYGAGQALGGLVKTAGEEHRQQSARCR
jgi:hypothetical protein